MNPTIFWVLTCAVGCGNVSNGLFEEDALFVDALPDEARQTLDFAADSTDEAERGLGERAELVELSVSIAGGVNGLVFALLGIVDGVRDLPPSDRTADSRRWGPYTGECGVDLTLRMAREVGVYDWSVSGHAASETDSVVLYGTHFAGTTVREGDGRLVWDHGLWNEWCGGKETGLMTVDYDNRDGVDLFVTVVGWSEDGVDPTDWTYAFRRSPELGDFQYRTFTDLEGDGTDTPASVTVRDRWIPGEGGRSDAFVTGGGFGADTYVWSQCWGSGGRLVFQEDSAGLTEQVGTAAACVFAEAAEVDRL